MDHPRAVQVLKLPVPTAALLAMASLAAAAPAADPYVAARLKAFVAAGYDPLTAPVDWYVREKIAGAQRALPGATGEIASGALAEASAWADAQASGALIVMHRGQIVAEHYGRGEHRGELFNSQSMAKTIVALMVGIAIDRHEIASVDDPVGSYLPEWAHDARGRITLRQLLQMASGLAQVDAGHGMALTLDNPAVAQFFGQDYLASTLALPLAEPPGTRFDYNNDDVRVVVRVLELVGRKRYPDLLGERLWRPLGLGDAEIGVDRPGGMVAGSTALFARPIDWAVLGNLIARRGTLGGTQIVSAGWVDAMRSPSTTNAGYGFYLWLGDQQVGGSRLAPVLTPWQSERFAAEDMIFMNGFGGQRVWIMADAELVVVRMGRRWPTAWDDAALPNTLYRGLVR